MQTNLNVNTITPDSNLARSLGLILVMLSCLLFTQAGVAGLVNINKASADALQENLKGVGPVKAKAIVQYRKSNGAFKSLDDLLNVPGIGKNMIKINKKNLSLSKGVVKAERTKAKAASNSKYDNKSTKSKKIEDDVKAKAKTKDKKVKSSKSKFSKDKKDRKVKKTKKVKKDKKAKSSGKNG